MDRDIEQTADLAAGEVWHDDDEPVDELLDDPARLNELAANINLLDPGSFR